MSLFIVAVAYNEPRFLNDASWDPNATTIMNSSLLSDNLTEVFVSNTGKWYAALYYGRPILAGSRESINTTTIGFSGFSLFVAGNDNVYFYDDDNKQVNVLLGNTTNSQPVMLIGTFCLDLFVDQNNTLYCSVTNMHEVVAKSLDEPMNTLVVAAGTGCAGSASDQLYYPGGIFVRSNFELYVADSNNNRIQRFNPGQMTASTLAGDGAPGTINLNHPIGVVLDGDDYLFIVDTNNHRIVRSGPNGYQCVAGCTNTSGSASNQLTYPQSLSFDSDGNMWIGDSGNGRIQKFALNNVSSGT